MKKTTFTSANKNKYMVASCAALLISCSFAYAMDSQSPQDSVHAQMTREALGGTLADDNLKLLIAANDSQDAAGSDGISERRRHFDANAINQCMQYVNREKNKALNFAAEADSEPESRLDALRHLGYMLHAVQDFYIRSNYVEQQLESDDNKNDPYNIPLVDWTKVPEGITSKGGTKLSAAKHGNPEDPLNKDSDTAGGGKTSLGGKVTYHSVARELGIRETQRQWNLFETLVRGRCGDRAPAVLAALRKASTPTSAQSAATKDRESSQTILGDPDKAEIKTDDRNPDNPGIDPTP